MKNTLAIHHFIKKRKNEKYFLNNEKKYCFN